MSKILIDVDGVVADVREALLDMVGEETDPKKWDIVKELSDEKHDKAVEIMNDPLFWASLPLIDGAKKAINRIRAMGHTIVWVTAPWQSCNGWGTARKAWIRSNFGGNDKVIIESDKEKVDGDIFIDDKVENVEAWRKAHPEKKAFIFDQPYNRDYHGATRFTWNDLEKIL